MKFILFSLAIALTSLLAGCANLPTLLSGQPDPNVVQAETTAQIAELAVNSFLALQKAQGEASHPDAQYLAQSLEREFPKQLATLQGLLEAYRKTKSAYAQSVLEPAVEAVKASGITAQGQINAKPLDRNRSDTFAPPMPLKEDELQSQIRSIGVTYESILRRLAVMDANYSRMARQFGVTNDIPPPPFPPVQSRTP